jgi:hypothetical protein
VTGVLLLAASGGMRAALMLRFMLDTDICIYVIKNRPAGLPNWT